MEATPHQEFSALYTSEPQLTRALAAEFRHDPQATERYFSSLLGVELGELTNVGCEKDQRVDILLEFEHKTIAIEAKIDHEISEDQLERESEVADYLMLLLLDADDAVEYLDQVAHVLTWKEVLSKFPDARVLLSDVKSLPASKVQVERVLRKTLKKMTIPDGWNLYVKCGARGMPSITIESPELPNGDWLCGQIQVIGQKMPSSFNDVCLEYHAGTHVEETDECYPSLDSNVPPSWVTNAQVLYETVLEGDPSTFDLKTNKPGTSRRPLGPLRKDLTMEHLTDAPWLAQGYINWALGVRAYPKPISEIDDLADAAMRLFTAWFGALEKRSRP
ncbi:hypothetical protein O3684_08665 [Pauljensenia sp. 20925_1_27]